LTPYLGHFAALATSLCWSVTSLFFTDAGQRVGPPVVNRVRLLLAVIFVVVIHLLMRGEALPLGTEPFRWGWLALSGVLGFVMGDAFLFEAFVMIGPRLTWLLMSMVPVISGLLAWGLLGEDLETHQWLGVALTVSGVALVMTERQGEQSRNAGEKRPISGVLLGLGAALGQASGLVTSKLGLEGAFPPLSGNLIRLLSATVVIWAFTLVRGRARSSLGAVRDQPRALASLTAGVLTGPVLGVTLSLFAVQNAPVGIASTLMSLPPVILLPVDRFLFGVKIGLRAIVGTLLAFGGTALLFL